MADQTSVQPREDEERRGRRFHQQKGWRLEVRVGGGDEGSWKPSLADETVTDHASSPFGDGR